MTAISTARVRPTPTPYRHLAEIGADALIAGEPPAAGGLDAGRAPSDFVLTGLGACTAITLRMYAEHKGRTLGEPAVEPTLLKNREGASRSERVLRAAAPLSDEQWARLVDIAGTTPVALTLQARAAITTQHAA